MALNHQLLDDPSGRPFDDPKFIPCFEVLLDHPRSTRCSSLRARERWASTVLIPKVPEWTGISWRVVHHAVPVSE